MRTSTWKAPQRSPSHVAALVFLVALWALFLFGGGPNALRLVFDHQSTVGVIEETQPLNHNRVVVRYEAGGRELRVIQPYDGTESQLGQEVTVYYIPAEPGVASLDTPASTFRSGVLGAFVAAGFAAYVAYFVLRWAGGRSMA